nr:hypothetical protein [Nostoc sp. C057]
MTTDCAASLKQVSLFAVKWQPKKDQPLPWEIRRKLCKPKGGRNKKGDNDNFHNRDYDFVSPSGEIFTGKGVRQFALLHGLNEVCLYAVLNGRLHSHKGWTKVVGGRKLPVPPTYHFLSPSGEIHTTTNLSEFARQHSLDPIALSRISRCLRAIHRGWRHCTPDGQPIVPPDIKHRKFTLLSPTGEIIEGSNLKAFAEQNGLSRTCLMNVLDGRSKEHKGWKLAATSTMTTTAATLKNFPTMTAIAPNLGKLFTGCTKRPATSEDIALLAPGDWISERECPWSWQFKNSCQDMAVGVWEGKEFFVPHHLLMVCEIVEGRVVEKFFKKSEVQDFKADHADLKVGDGLRPTVGDRIRITRTRTQNLSQWIGKTAIITAINGETISVAAGEGKEKKHLTLKKGWYEVAPWELAKSECTQQSQVTKTISEKYHKGYQIEFFVLEDGETIKFKIFNDQWQIYDYWHEYESLDAAELGAIEWLDKEYPGERISPLSKDALERMGRAVGLPSNAYTRQFKVGDRIISKHPLSLGQIFVIEEYPSVFADSSVSYEWLVTNTNLVLRIDQVSPIEEAEKFFNNQELCLQPDISIVEVAAIQKERSPQDTDLSGQLTTTQVQQVFTGSDSQESCSLSKISDPLQMSLLPDSQYQISVYSQHLVQIFPWLVSELGLLEFADNCFLKDSDLFDSNAQVHLCLKTLTDSLAQTKQLPSRKSLKRLQVWGIAAPGNLGMVTGTSPQNRERVFIVGYHGRCESDAAQATEEIFS